MVTGVGFLGGGAILRTGLTIQGLTTAAGLWLVAAIGLSAGRHGISVAPAEYERHLDEGRVQVTLQARVSPTAREDLLAVLDRERSDRR